MHIYAHNNVYLIVWKKKQNQIKVLHYLRIELLHLDLKRYVSVSCHSIYVMINRIQLIKNLCPKLWISGVSGSAAKERSKSKLPGHLWLYSSAPRCQEWVGEVFCWILYHCCFFGQYSLMNIYKVNADSIKKQHLYCIMCYSFGFSYMNIKREMRNEISGFGQKKMQAETIQNILLTYCYEHLFSSKKLCFLRKQCCAIISSSARKGRKTCLFRCAFFSRAAATLFNERRLASS